jgi:two-component system, LuxR family, response regulator DctR
MTQHPDAKVFIVDDDVGVRDALAWLLRTRRLLSEGYDSADAFLHEIARWRQEPTVPCCLLLDVRMPGTSGLALFEHLLTLPWQSALPVIFLSGHADVPTAVDAVKRGAFDFCEKPFSDNALVDRVEQALALSARCRPAAAPSAACSSGWTA